MYGWDCVCQVHQARQQSRDHPLQQERAHIHEERLILPALQNRRFKARLGAGSIPMSSVTYRTSPISGTIGSIKLIEEPIEWSIMQWKSEGKMVH